MSVLTSKVSESTDAAVAGVAVSFNSAGIAGGGGGAVAGSYFLAQSCSMHIPSWQKFLEKEPTVRGQDDWRDEKTT